MSEKIAAEVIGLLTLAMRKSEDVASGWRESCPLVPKASTYSNRPARAIAIESPGALILRRNDSATRAMAARSGSVISPSVERADRRRKDDNPGTLMTALRNIPLIIVRRAWSSVIVVFTCGCSPN